jgi:hypothetical protein
MHKRDDIRFHNGSFVHATTISTRRPNTARKIIKRVNGSAHVYEVRPRKDKRGVNLISDALPFRRLWAQC